MLLWFVGTAVLSVWFVFRDARFDNRFLVLGALLPDVVDGIWGGARAFHSVITSVGVLLVVMLSTIGRRPIRRRLLAIPIGLFLHLVFDGAFADTGIFWWPLTGASFDGARLPVAERGWFNLVLEAIGMVLVVHIAGRFGLADPERRRRLWRDGSLTEVTAGG